MLALTCSTVFHGELTECLHDGTLEHHVSLASDVCPDLGPFIAPNTEPGTQDRGFNWQFNYGVHGSILVMAYFIKRKGVYYICHTANGARERFSTGLKTNVATHKRRAQDLLAEYEAKEIETRTRRPKFREEERWEMWVPAFIAMRYRNKPETARRFQSVWRTLLIFFKEFKIETPRQLTRDLCFKYFEWRVVPNAKIGLMPAVHNTAHLEMTKLGMLMKEAVIRGYAQGNPCRELGVGMDEKHKPADLSDAVVSEIEKLIQEVTDENHRTILWRSFLLARYHGVRLSETHVHPMRDVDLTEQGGETITFHQKMGRVRTKPLHFALVPLFKELQAAGATEFFHLPMSFSSFWWNYISRRWNLPAKHGAKICFHSFRVRAQNKLRRAGVAPEIRKAYLSHERQADVHDGYSRVQMDEMRACHKFL